MHFILGPTLITCIVIVCVRPSIIGIMTSPRLVSSYAFGPMALLNLILVCEISDPCSFLTNDYDGKKNKITIAMETTKAHNFGAIHILNFVCIPCIKLNDE